MASVKIGSRYSMPSREGCMRSRIVEGRVHAARVDVAPAIAKRVTVDAVDVEARLVVPLQDGHGVVLSLEEHVDRLASELRGVEAVERQRSSAALRVADLASEDRLAGRLAAAASRK